MITQNDYLRFINKTRNIMKKRIQTQIKAMFKISCGPMESLISGSCFNTDSVSLSFTRFPKTSKRCVFIHKNYEYNKSVFFNLFICFIS